MFAALQHFFTLNATLVYFVYGLVFFVLGVVIVLQSRKHSRLELAHGLDWLAAFGITHGAYEWGEVFIPIQSTYLPAPVIDFLKILHAILLAMSLIFLFQFGVEMLKHRWPRLTVLPLLVGLLWMILFVMPGVFLWASLDALHPSGIIWARYLIGFPAALSAALGLRLQADRYIKPMNLSSIYSTLRIAGVSLLAYAFFAGLVVPAGDFFPANWLNEARLMAWTGIPVPVFRSLIGLILALAIIRTLDVFEVEVDQIIEKIELERNLALQREHIGRELHDITIQTIYTAGLLVQSAQQKLPAEHPVAQRLERSMAVMNEAIAGLRIYIDGLRPSQPEQTLAAALQAVAGDKRWASLVTISLYVNLHPDATLAAPRLQHVLAVLNEALSNAARHARAHQVQVQVNRTHDSLEMKIQDDGVGFQEKQNGKGYGLRNMRDRARLLGGTLVVEAKPGHGTQVKLVIPWESEE